MRSGHVDDPDDYFAARVEAPLVIVPHSNKDAYLDRYALPDKGHTDRSDAFWPAPYWDIDTGFAALLMLLTVVDAGLGACFFGAPGRPDRRLPRGVRRAAGVHPDRGHLRRLQRRAAPATSVTGAVRRRMSCTTASGPSRTHRAEPALGVGAEQVLAGRAGDPAQDLLEVHRGPSPAIAGQLEVVGQRVDDLQAAAVLGGRRNRLG